MMFSFLPLRISNSSYSNGEARGSSPRDCARSMLCVAAVLAVLASHLPFRLSASVPYRTMNPPPTDARFYGAYKAPGQRNPGPGAGRGALGLDTEAREDLPHHRRVLDGCKQMQAPCRSTAATATWR